MNRDLKHRLDQRSGTEIYNHSTLRFLILKLQIFNPLANKL